jgi:hypothetical protein
MQAISKEPKPKRKWETPAVTVLAFRDTRGSTGSVSDSPLPGGYGLSS